MMHALDNEIETAESLIATYDEHDRFHRLSDGTWIEWRDTLTSHRAKLVAAQAVLFAQKEGL